MKFDEDFMFELTDEELEDLQYKNCTANISSKSCYNPHVFTEQVFRMSDDETRRRLLRYFELVGICNQINDNNVVKK